MFFSGFYLQNKEKDMWWLIIIVPSLFEVTFEVLLNVNYLLSFGCNEKIRNINLWNHSVYKIKMRHHKYFGPICCKYLSLRDFTFTLAFQIFSKKIRSQSIHFLWSNYKSSNFLIISKVIHYYFWND